MSISFGVQAPSSAAKPSQVADLTNRFESCMPLISLISNNLLTLFSFGTNQGLRPNWNI
jgi:hypothetical protein